MKSLFPHLAWVFALSIFSAGNAYSWPGMPYPLHGENGELIVWLGELGNMTPAPDGQYFIIRGAGARQGREY